MLSPNQDFLRYASPNERRTISREDLGCYHAVIIGAVYEFGREFSIDSPSVLFEPVAHCIEQHPFLNVLVGDRHTDKAYYHRAPSINLEDHIEVQKPAVALGDDTDHWSAVEGVLKSNLDRPFSHTIPPWRVIVLPFDRTQYFIAFAFSHVLGDGPSGVSFHRSFLEALRKPSSKGPSAPSIIQPSPQPLPVPFDTPERLPISWSFLLMPLIAVLVPQFVAKWLGFKAQVSDVDEGTWTGLPVAFDPSHPEASQSKVVVRVVEADLIEKAIQESRKHNAKLTGLLHQFLARALSKTLANKEHTNLASQTAVNMRKSLGVPSDEMGEFVSATYLVHPITSSTGPLSDDEWEKASLATKKFAETAVTFQDQPIGLLRYAPSIRKWLEGKLGQQRDCSYEMSNIGAFVDEHPEDASIVKINQVIFGQPGHVLSAPVCFNFSSVKDGDMVYTVTWPTAALGVAEEEEERVVDEICKSIQADFEALA